jgi:hypothetical protein
VDGVGTLRVEGRLGWTAHTTYGRPRGTTIWPPTTVYRGGT